MRIGIGLALAIAFGGPAAAGVQVVVPAAAPVARLPPEFKSRPVSLTRFAANMPPGRAWLDESSAPYFLLPCVGSGNVSLWKEQDNRIEDFATFERIFRQELAAAGFSSGGDPTNLFEEQQKADLQVGALVTEVRAKTCVTWNVAEWLQGSAVMNIEWQVYSASQGKVLARIKTQGGYEMKPSKEGTLLAVLNGAFADSVRRLTADETFRQIVTASPVVTPAILPPLNIRLAPAASAVPLAVAVRSVVSIQAGDRGGSGVLISPDGYILTNYHVAGSTGPVRVHWADGSDSVGDVIRGDARRDVALIRVTPRADALEVRKAGAKLGETVFAVGTPLRKEFANTVTRGIVSGARLIDGLAMVQSDVAVDHGSSGGPLLDEDGRIIALTVSMYAPDDVTHNISFFIPIHDALKALSVDALN